METKKDKAVPYKKLPKFTNLDLLRSESVVVQFLETKFDLGYIPSGVAVPLLEINQANVNAQEAGASNDEIMAAEIKSVALFCGFYDEKFSENYVAKNATAQQVDAFYEMLVWAILNNFAKKNPAGENEADAQSKKKPIGKK